MKANLFFTRTASYTSFSKVCGSYWGGGSTIDDPRKVVGLNFWEKTEEGTTGKKIWGKTLLPGMGRCRCIGWVARGKKRVTRGE